VELRLDRVGLLLDRLEATCEYSRARLEGLTDEEYLWEPAPGAWSVRRRDQDEQLDQPGFGQDPWGLDAEVAFIGIVWWTNRELIHHLAECALLRDLWRTRAPQERA
jgi:hypothetical protein